MTDRKLLQTPMDEIEFSVRAAKIIEIMGIQTVGELAEFAESDFKLQRNCGKRTIEEIKTVLAGMGLKLSPKRKTRIRNNDELTYDELMNKLYILLDRKAAVDKRIEYLLKCDNSIRRKLKRLYAQDGELRLERRSIDIALFTLSKKNKKEDAHD